MIMIFLTSIIVENFFGNKNLLWWSYLIRFNLKSYKYMNEWFFLLFKLSQFLFYFWWLYDEYLIFNIIKFFLTTIIIYLSNQCILNCDLIIMMKFKGQYDSWPLSKKNHWTNKQKTNDELITKKIIWNFNDWLISVFLREKKRF